MLILYKEEPLVELFMNENFELPNFLQDTVFVGAFAKDHNPATYDFAYNIFTNFIWGPKVDQCIFREVNLDEGNKVCANDKHRSFQSHPYPYPEFVYLLTGEKILKIETGHAFRFKKLRRIFNFHWQIYSFDDT